MLCYSLSVLDLALWDYFVLYLCAFVVLDLVSSVLWQEIGYEERLQNDLFCAEWDVKPYSVNQSLICVGAYRRKYTGGTVAGRT